LDDLERAEDGAHAGEFAVGLFLAEAAAFDPAGVNAFAHGDFAFDAVDLVLEGGLGHGQ
jgi:hypothetical protein